LLNPLVDVSDILVAPDSSQLVVIPAGNARPLVFSLDGGKFASGVPRQIKQPGPVLFLDQRRIGVLLLTGKEPRIVKVQP
jgi:hypothetical protein